jgi:hypothetical protein
MPTNFKAFQYAPFSALLSLLGLKPKVGHVISKLHSAITHKTIIWIFIAEETYYISRSIFPEPRNLLSQISWNSLYTMEWDKYWIYVKYAFASSNKTTSLLSLLVWLLLWPYASFLSLGSFFTIVILYMVVMTPWSGISPSQGLRFHTGQHKLNKKNSNSNSDIHASSGIRTHEPSVWTHETVHALDSTATVIGK